MWLLLHASIPTRMGRWALPWSNTCYSVAGFLCITEKRQQKGSPYFVRQRDHFHSPCPQNNPNQWPVDVTSVIECSSCFWLLLWSDDRDVWQKPRIWTSPFPSVATNINKVSTQVIHFMLPLCYQYEVLIGKTSVGNWSSVAAGKQTH